MTMPPAASPRTRRGARVVVPGKLDATGRPVTRLPDGTSLAGRYELTFLAAGGMGAVYRAMDHQDGGEVIVKEAFSRHPDDHAQLIVALTQEREALIRLKHPGIVTPLDFFVESGACYLVLEYVPGRTLEEVLRSGRPLEEQEAVDLALQICDALEHIHANDLVYRDLKPENIMVTDQPDGSRAVKIIDFGTVRLYKLGQRKDTAALGTVGFAPPEQFGTGQTDRRSDIYSLGATLHYVLSKRHPDQTPFSFPPLRSLNAAVSPALEAVVEQAVKGRPDERFASVAAMRTALLQTRKVCAQCGAANRARSKFCIRCGQPLGGAPAPAPPTRVAPAHPPATPVANAPHPSQPLTGPIPVHVRASLQGPPPTAQRAPQVPPPVLAGGVTPPPLSGPTPVLAPTPRPLGRTIRVDPSGPGDFRRIAEAIEAAHPGDVIEVAAGTYRESLRICDRIVLKGAGRDRTILRSDGDRPVLEVSGSDGTWVEGFHLEYTGTRPNCAVWVLNSRVILQDNRIQGATLSGVEFGSQATGEVRGNEIHGNRQTGIFVHSRSAAAIVGNHLHHNGLDTNTAGIEVREQSNMAIEGNLIETNGIGIYVHDHSSPQIRGNTISRNGQRTDFMAVEIKESSDPIVEGNVIQENSGGILVKGRSRPRIIGNHLLRNGSASGGSGIEVLEASAPHIEGNLIEGNGAGVAVRDGSTPRLRRNQIVGNGLGGKISALEVGGASQVVIDHNLLARNTAGVLVHGGSRAQLLDNVVVENGLSGELNGIEVRGKSDAVIFHNIVLQNGGAGVWFHQESSGEVENNIVVGNLRGLVGAESGRAPLTCGYNNVYGNKRDYVGVKRPATDIGADPMFADARNWDFRLAASSPSALAGRGRIPQGPRGA